MADIERRSRDFSPALKHYEEALTLAHDLGEMTLATHATAGLALAHLAQGDVARAEAMARRVLISAEERGSDYEQGLAQFVLGRVFRQQGRLDDAIAALQSAASFFERSEALNELTEALLHLADAALPLRRRRTLLMATLERVALVGKEHGVGHSLASAAREVPAVLEYAASRRSGGDFFGDPPLRSVTRINGFKPSLRDADFPLWKSGHSVFLKRESVAGSSSAWSGKAKRVRNSFCCC
jgi:tetratricopeptide (TPR) repeat protein